MREAATLHRTLMHYSILGWKCAALSFHSRDREEVMAGGRHVVIDLIEIILR